MELPIESDPLWSSSSEFVHTLPVKTFKDKKIYIWVKDLDGNINKKRYPIVISKVAPTCNITDLFFPDLNVENAYRQYSGILTGPINLYDQEVLGTFRASIGDPFGIECLLNVNGIGLSSFDNYNGNLSNLKEMPWIGSLELSGLPNISDIDFISDFKWLVKLWLHNSNLTTLPNVTLGNRIAHIRLENSKISDISSLVQYKNLYSLNLHSTLISDISVLNARIRVILQCLTLETHQN